MGQITVIIITQGRLKLLMKCLESLKQFPEESEIILVSNGETLASEARLFLEQNFKNHKILESGEVFAAGKARNWALSLAAPSDWVFLIDDDAYLPQNYWTTAMKYLGQKEVDVLGGPDITPRDMGYFAKSVAITLMSPFCTGLTFSRHYPLGKKIQFATEENLTSAQLWIRRKILDDIQFPESFRRGEESYFLKELSDKNVGMFYHPQLKLFHYRRENLWQIVKINFLGGFFRSQMMRQKSGFSGSYYLPSLFVLMHFLVFYDLGMFFELVKIYTLLIGCISLGISQRQREFMTFPLVFFLHYIIVVSYGVGFLKGRLNKVS